MQDSFHPQSKLSNYVRLAPKPGRFAGGSTRNEACLHRPLKRKKPTPMKAAFLNSQSRQMTRLMRRLVHVYSFASVLNMSMLTETRDDVTSTIVLSFNSPDCRSEWLGVYRVYRSWEVQSLTAQTGRKREFDVSAMGSVSSGNRLKNSRFASDTMFVGACRWCHLLKFPLRTSVGSPSLPG